MDGDGGFAIQGGLEVAMKWGDGTPGSCSHLASGPLPHPFLGLVGPQKRPNKTERTAL